MGQAKHKLGGVAKTTGLAAATSSSFSYNHVVTELLKKAFDKISETLPNDEQDEFGRYLLAVMEDEARWQTVIAKSPDKLRKLADHALEAYRSGRTSVLDPEKL